MMTIESNLPIKDCFNMDNFPNLTITLDWSDCEGAFRENPVPTSKLVRNIDFEGEHAYIGVYEGDLAREVYLAENDYTRDVESGDVSIGDDSFTGVGDGIIAFGSGQYFDWEQVSEDRAVATSLKDDSRFDDIPHVPHGEFVGVDTATVDFAMEDGWVYPSEVHLRVRYTDSVFDGRVLWSVGADVTRPPWATQE